MQSAASAYLPSCMFHFAYHVTKKITLSSVLQNSVLYGTNLRETIHLLVTVLGSSVEDHIGRVELILMAALRPAVFIVQLNFV